MGHDQDPLGMPHVVGASMMLTRIHVLLFALTIILLVKFDDIPRGTVQWNNSDPLSLAWLALQNTTMSSPENDKSKTNNNELMHVHVRKP